MLLGLWPSTACTLLLFMCGNACTHTSRCTHSPCVLLDCLPFPFVGSLPSLSPSAILLAPHPLIWPALCSLILSFISIAYLVALLSIFFSSALLSLFLHFLPFFLCLSLNTSLLLLPLSMRASTGPPLWAAGQCGSETGCNYFTPPLTAIVGDGREEEQEKEKGTNTTQNMAKINPLINYSHN